MIRTFLAVELPDSMQKTIRSLQQQMDFKGIKLVKPELVHVTLKFFGNISEAQVGPLLDALSDINCAPFNTRVAGVGVFPNPSYMKVIWLGAHGEFELLHSEVERVLEEFKFKKDRGKFTAHATLARVKYLDMASKEQLAQVLAGLHDVDAGEFLVDTIAFKKSILTPQGPIYETLSEIPLH